MSRVKLENEALRLVREGYSIRQVTEMTGLRDHEIEQLLRAVRYPPHLVTACDKPGCGQPQQGAGHPRKGWVQLRCGAERPWFCSYECVLGWVKARVR